MKKFRILALLLSLIMVLTACGGDSKNKEKTEGNGTYEGRSKGHNADIVLEVEFKEKKIANIKVKEHKETENLGDVAMKKLLEEAVKHNTTNLDSVAGATVSSKAFLEALKDAIKNAGLKVEDFSKKVEKTTEKKESKEITKEVVVIGAGGAGFIAAIKAKESGADVIIIEKLPVIGGNTLISGAEYAAPANWLQEKEKLEDSKELFIKDVEKAGGDKALINVLGENALKGAEWLRDDVKVEWTDELMFFGGHSVKRSLIPKGASGKEIIEKLSAKAKELNIEVLTETEAYELIQKDGAVVGVKAKTKEGELVINSKAVILTTGGFGANPEMAFSYDKEIDDKIHTTNSPGARGDGIKMAQAVGAELVGMEHIQLYPVCDTETGKLLYTGDTRLTSGALLVNKEGKRFVEELDTRRAISLGIKAQTGNKAYQIWDQTSTEKSGVMIDHAGEAEDLISRKKMVKADTLEEAAKFFGIDEKNLKETLDKFNKDSEAGKDTEFNLRRLGFKVEKAPFYIIEASPAIHHTMGGVKIDTEARVLNKDGKPIKGLYAAGEVTGGIHGTNRLGSVAITDITVFGLIAGESAAKGK